jgi:hypothetical protein
MEVSGQVSTPGVEETAPGTLLYRRLDGPQNQSERCGVDKNSFPLPGIDPRPSSPKSVAIQTELFRIPPLPYM